MPTSSTCRQRVIGRAKLYRSSACHLQDRSHVAADPAGQLRQSPSRPTIHHLCKIAPNASGRPMERNIEWWRTQLAHTRSTPVPHVQALTPLQPLKGITKPVLVHCDDGLDYVVKGGQVGRSLIADQIVGMLGKLLDAPVPEVAIVEIAEELVVPGSMLEHFVAGPAHGSRYIPDCIDSPYIRYADAPGNPLRFAAISVLFGWADPEDRQYLYERREPHSVFSIDHGAFFNGSIDWTIESLEVAPTARCDAAVYSSALVHPELLREAISRLKSITDEKIISVVNGPPTEWGLALDERAAIAHYLASRREALLASDLAS